jgi:hypothetical protein
MLGQPFHLDLARARPHSISLLLHGPSSTSWHGIPLPFDLATLGAPGCQVLAAGNQVDVLATDPSGAGRLRFVFPVDPNLFGRAFYNQFVVYDPGANALGFVVSQGGRGTIGY